MTTAGSKGARVAGVRCFVDDDSGCTSSSGSESMRDWARRRVIGGNVAGGMREGYPFPGGVEQSDASAADSAA